MEKNKSVLAPTVKPVKTVEMFKQGYETLCKETGFQIGYEPKWVMSLDTGDYRLRIAVSIVPLQENK